MGYITAGIDLARRLHSVQLYGMTWPLLTKSDGSKMGKRKIVEGLEPYVRVFRDRGYLPEALVDFLALLGWSPGGDQEVALTLDQLTDVFSLEKVSKAGARFDIKKLNDLNGLGRYKDTTSSFDLNLLRNSQDREYPEFPMTGEQLLNGQFSSKPVKITEIMPIIA